MNASTVEKVRRIRRRNERRDAIQRKRTLSIMGLPKDADYDKAIEHLREGYKDGFGSRVSRRNPSKEYVSRKALSTPFAVEPDEATETPLTALMGSSLDFFGLAENDRMDTADDKATDKADDNPETVEAFEGLEPVKEDALA